jgi:hypothetical protein
MKKPLRPVLVLHGHELFRDRARAALRGAYEFCAFPDWDGLTQGRPGAPEAHGEPRGGERTGVVLLLDDFASTGFPYSIDGVARGSEVIDWGDPLLSAFLPALLEGKERKLRHFLDRGTKKPRLVREEGRIGYSGERRIYQGGEPSRRLRRSSRAASRTSARSSAPRLDHRLGRSWNGQDNLIRDVILDGSCVWRLNVSRGRTKMGHISWFLPDAP